MKYTLLAKAIVDKGYLDPIAAERFMDDLEAIAMADVNVDPDDYQQLLALWSDVRAQANSVAEDMARDMNDMHPEVV